MRIGIMSDTHDNLPLIRRAVDRMNEEEVDLVLHAGDFVSPFVIPALSDLEAPLIGVWGNNDGDRPHLLEKSDEYERIEIRGAFLSLKILRGIRDLQASGGLRFKGRRANDDRFCLDCE